MLLRECDNCGAAEERLFTDTWTGVELCPTCLSECINELTMSPATEGDNILQLLPDLREKVGV